MPNLLKLSRRFLSSKSIQNSVTNCKSQSFKTNYGTVTFDSPVNKVPSIFKEVYNPKQKAKCDDLYSEITDTSKSLLNGLTSGKSESFKTNYKTLTLDSSKSNIPSIFREVHKPEKKGKDDNLCRQIKDSENSILRLKTDSPCYLMSHKTWKRREEIVNICTNSVIHNDDSVLVVDKPYGITVHKDVNYPYDLRTVLLSVAAQLGINDPSSFHPIGRPDLRTTGVVIFAKTLEAAKMYRDLYSSGHVDKTYRAVVRGIPDQLVGDINVPVGEIKCSDSRYKVSIPSSAFLNQPNFRKQIHDKRSSLTSYKVLRSNSDSVCSLVECTTRQGRKHQLRVHLSYYLNTPILGDHRYSTILGRVPQKLCDSTAECLGIRPSLSRHLPMLLHCHSVKIPSLSGGVTSFTAHVPDFYSHICRLLGL